jgi:hypothetical protein
MVVLERCMRSERLMLKLAKNRGSLQLARFSASGNLSSDLN